MAVGTKRLIIVCGLPFSGKTTFVEPLPDPKTIISRDQIIPAIFADLDRMNQIRIAAAKIDQPVSRLYETLAQNAFNDALTIEYCREVSRQIRSATTDTIVVDGLHLQPLSRSFQFDFPDYTIEQVVIDTPADVCIARLNEAINLGNLTGFRASVTPDLIRRLAEVSDFTSPSSL